MNELDALATWNNLPMPQRAALLAAIPLSYKGGINDTWSMLPRETQVKLLAMDWNFMLGGKLGVK